ncbi:MAG: hypothetical protein LBC56_05175, partial [Oscillospiraceae bacterium]|nr:hypothetical protein [Oscillospiraceae bacterium]
RKKKKAGNLTWLEATHRYRKIIAIGGKQRDIYGKTPEEVAKKIDELSGILLVRPEGFEPPTF